MALKAALGTAPIPWCDVQAHRKDGDLWVVISGKVYDVSSWAKVHPGGELVLMHLAGRDATQAFNAYHPAWVRSKLSPICVGTVKPAVDKFEADKVFEQLKREVEGAGLMQPRLVPYIRLAGLLGLIFCVAAWTAAQGNVLAAALTTALFWQQSAFVGHDIGHNAVTQDRKLDSRIGLLVNAAIGIGLSWWKSTHNVHHTVVNAIDSDPDIQFMPLIAISDEFFQPVWSTYHQDLLVFDGMAQRLISWQHLTFIPLLMIAKFGLYLQTIKQLVGGKSYIQRGPEVAAQAVFFAWYIAFTACFTGLAQKLAYIFLSHAAFFVLHLQICLSHFACPTTREMPQDSEAWMCQQVKGTMNWSCPAWMDWFHGGLQFQIEHHLFPRMPRHNLRAASQLVKPACANLSLHYHSPTFLGAIAETLAVLHQQALRARRQRVQQNIEGAAQGRRPTTILSRAFI